ncbi:uncharacterized protein LOC141526317 [Cotesia typhae]|uniref:uncharacterized protein LOC141526317 n=1 Tax=Cotesia typhae TaxID=2053667 RepID=UPI003D68E22D
MFHWIISAALIANALATGYNEPPCTWTVLCSPNMIGNIRENGQATTEIQKTIPGAVYPAADCDDTKTVVSTSTGTSSGSSDFEMTQIIDGIIGLLTPTSTKPVLPRTTTTTTTTTTEAPKPAINENELNTVLAELNILLRTHERIPSKFAGWEKIDYNFLKKYLANNPELLQKLVFYLRSTQTTKTPSHPHHPAPIQKSEPCDEETKQSFPHDKPSIPAPPRPTTTTTTTTTTTPAPAPVPVPAPGSGSTTVVKTISGPRGYGQKFEHKSSKSSESSSNSITHYTYVNSPTGYKFISDEEFKGPHTFSADWNQVKPNSGKFSTFQQIPCEFVTGVMSLFPCNNVLTKETAVGKTIPMTNSYGTYHYNFGPIELGNTNTDFEIKDSLDC